MHLKALPSQVIDLIVFQLNSVIVLRGRSIIDLTAGTQLSAFTLSSMEGTVSYNHVSPNDAFCWNTFSVIKWGLTVHKITSYNSFE